MRFLIALLFTFPVPALAQLTLIDDFSDPSGATFGGRWSWSTDQVMGGVSTGSARLISTDQGEAAYMSGQVSTANNGGFIQIRLPFERLYDARAHDGIELTVRGNGEPYYVHLRDRNARAPWHVFAAGYETTGEIQTIRVPFTSFTAYSNRTTASLDISALRSIGLVAGNDDYEAELTIFEVGFY